MARKLTIRRVGGLLPAVSLVVLVLLASLITWLSTAGLPDKALRYIEQEAARQGIYLSVGQLKLSPSSGLAIRARNVRLCAAAGDTEPLAEFYRATVGISASELLFHGRLRLTMAEVRELNLYLPTDTGPPLALRHATASALIRQGRFVRLTSGNACLENIPIRMQGAFMLPEKNEQNGSSPQLPLDLPALLEPYRTAAGCIQRAISSQNWSADERPSIELQLLDLRNTQMGARISIPRYDVEQFHFREGYLDIAYKHNTILINSIRFRTVDPDSKVTIQGGYDVPLRQLSVNINSTAAITRMAESLTIPGVDMDCLHAWLSRFKHPDDRPPSIMLNSNICFEEDFSLKDLFIQGTLSQQEFTFGQTAVDELALSFYYRNGNFNIDRLQLTFPTGSVTASAFASSETGKGKAHIIADLAIPQLLGFASEFTPEPLSLPEGLELEGNLQLDANAELDMPAFISGARELGQFLPSLHKVELTVGIDKAAHCGCSMEQPRLKLTLKDLHQLEGELLPSGMELAQLMFRARTVNIPSADADSPTLRGAALELELHELSLRNANGGIAPRIGSAAGRLNIDATSAQGYRIESLELELADAANIRPLADTWRQKLQHVALRLTTGTMFSQDTLLGALDSRLTLSENGEMEFNAVLDRDGNRLFVDLHPQLSEDGLLTLEHVELNIPVAGFEPILALTGATVTQVLLPESATIAGSATLNANTGRLLHAEGTIDIPHLVRTPGDRVAAFKGEHIPLAVHLRGHASGKEDGHFLIGGNLAVIHKTDTPGRERKLTLDFRGDTASNLFLKGANTIDVGVLDRLIDLQDAHLIMRDFDTHGGSTTDITIQEVAINYADGVTVTASCDAQLANIGYQMNAFVDETTSAGASTGREKLRTDFGKDPFRRIEKGTAHVDVLYKEDAEGKVEATRISILNADLTYDNRPWLRSQGFKGGVPSSRMQGDAIIIDVEDSFVELRNVRGSVYPAYAIGAYYDDLPGFLEMLVLEKPARVETQHCLFPIYSDCKRPMTGCIRILSEEAGLHFLGTTFPLRELSGFIWFEKNAVRLDRLNAACWDGAINAALVIDYSKKHTGFDGYASLSNINLKPLAAAYGSKQQPALCSGNIRFRTPSPELRDLQAYGELHIVNGDLMSLSVFRPVGDLISDLPGHLAELERAALNSEEGKPTWLDRQLTKLFKTAGEALGSVGESASKVANNIPFANHFLRYDLQEAHGLFSIGRGKLMTDNLKALGYNLNVGVQLAIDLEKLTLEGDLWPKISSVPTVILSPITFLSKFMIDIQLFGNLDNIQWKFALNRKQKGNEEECSATDKEPRQTIKPKTP